MPDDIHHKRLGRSTPAHPFPPPPHANQPGMWQSTNPIDAGEGADGGGAHTLSHSKYQ